jgi:predicted nuclease of predicted toxin-antitoxin system
MKIKLDENLPLRLANLLKDLGHELIPFMVNCSSDMRTARFGTLHRRNRDF